MDSRCSCYAVRAMGRGSNTFGDVATRSCRLVKGGHNGASRDAAKHGVQRLHAFGFGCEYQRTSEPSRRVR